MLSRARCYSALFLCPAILFTCITPVRAAWRYVGDAGPAKKIADGVEYSTPEGLVSITIVTEGIARVRFSHAAQFAADSSYAVSGDAKKVEFTFDQLGAADRLTTDALRIDIQRQPLRLRFSDGAGHVLEEDTAGSGMAFDEQGRVRVWKALDDDTNFFGFGEKTGLIDKRGAKLGGYEMTMWNSDVYGYDDSVDPLYADIPFFLTLKDHVTHGTFFDNTWRSTFDIGHESRKYFDFGAEGGELNYYVIAGPRPADVLRRYRALTGAMPMPPLWSLGFNQSRYSYYPESRVREIAKEFRARQIPADVLWFDIHYMDGYRIFTWDPKRFPDPKKMLADLAEMNFHTVSILDPGVKVDPNYAAYQSGMREDIFVKTPDGKPFVGPVWPGDAVFPDFTDARARAWWSKRIAELAANGLSGIWNDMNEPAVFNVPSGTMPDDVIFHHDGKAVTHAEIHNVFGMQMSRATQAGLLELRPNERPFVLTRDSYSGGQKYAAVWTGDNSADWAHLRDGITTLLGMGISGFPFVGNDIGGFIGPADADLWTRWAEVGAFFPFMRAHAEDGAPNKEPWAFGPEYEAYNSKAIERRYRFLPYIYNQFRESSETGMPMMRALVLEFPDDPATFGMADEFLFGRDLLVAPVLSPATRSRNVYIPRGSWYDLRDDKPMAGGKSAKVQAEEDEIPLFAAEGAILFTATGVQSRAMQSTADWGQSHPVFEIFTHGKTSREYYEDDGISFGYRKGVYFKRTISAEVKANGATVDLAKAEGVYEPAHKVEMVVIHFARKPASVTLNGARVRDEAAVFDPAKARLSIEIPQSAAEQKISVAW